MFVLVDMTEHLIFADGCAPTSPQAHVNARTVYPYPQFGLNVHLEYELDPLRQV